MAGFAEAEAELKRAWDSESSSVAEGTMGGMRRPDKALSPDGAVHLRTVSAFQQSPTSPESAASVAFTNESSSLIHSPIKEESKEDVLSSDGSSFEDTESESDIEGVPATPIQSPGMALPPPLRNIPHQTPNGQMPPKSPTPPIPPTEALLKEHRHSVPTLRIPTKISVLPNSSTRSDSLTVPPARRDSLTVPPNRHHPFKHAGKGQGRRQHRSKLSDLDKVTLPNNKVVIGARDAGMSDSVGNPAVLKYDLKDNLFSDPVSAEQISEQTHQGTELEVIQENTGPLRVSEVSATEHPTNQATAVSSTSNSNSNVRGGAPVASIVMSGPTTISAPARKRPHRAPSQRLQKSIDQQSSSSSDLEDISSTESDENEKQDKFDTNVMMQPRSLPGITGRRSLVTLSSHPALPPLAAVPLPKILPPILDTTPTVLPSTPYAGFPPSYQESRQRLGTGTIYDRNLGTEYQAMSGTNAGVGTDESRLVRPAEQPYQQRARSPIYSGQRDFGRGGGGTNAQQQQQHHQRVTLDCRDLSDNPLHLAAMEGVGVAQLKALALQFGVDYRDSGGRTALMYAVIGNQPKVCEVLLKMKAEVNCKDLTGLTPLLWATYKAHADVIRVLLKNGADVQCLDQDGRSVFHWAMKTPNVHCLKWLCKLSNIPEVINQPDSDGLTALHWAVMSDQPSHIKMLLSHTGADVSAQDCEGRAPLNYAVLNFSPSCIRAILDHNEGAVNLIDIKGRTVLHYACAEGSADCVRTLLSYSKCDIHSTDNNGTTPLHWAASANQPGLVQLLLRRGADRKQRDHKEYTALDYAQQRGHAECVRILSSYNIQRPASAISLTSSSRTSLRNATADPPTLDEHGHVVFKRFQRQFSLSGLSMSSMDRMPADGQAQSENSPEEQGEEGAGQGKEEEQEQVCGGGGGENMENPGTSASQPTQQQEVENDNVNEIEAEQVQRTRHGGGGGGWKMLLCCGSCAKRSSTVAPL